MRKAHVVLLLSIVLLILAASPIYAQATGLVYGQSTIGALSAQTPLALYTFQGTAGDFVEVELIPITPNFAPNTTLIGRGQQFLAVSAPVSTAAGVFDSRLSFQLTETGSYTLLIGSADGRVGQFLIRLFGQSISNGGVVGADSPAQAQLGAGGAAVTFALQGDPDQPIVVTVQVDNAAGLLRAQLRDASGAAVNDVTGQGAVALLLPASSGVYSLIVSWLGDFAAIVSISLGAAGAPPPPVDTPEAPGVVETPEVEPPADADEPTSAPVLPSLTASSTVIGPTASPSSTVAAPLAVTATALPPSLTPTLEAPTTAPVQATLTFTPSPTLQPPTETYTPSYTPTLPPTATYTPTSTAAPPTVTYTPSYTPTTPPPPPEAPEDARFNNPLNIPLDTSASVTDFVSYPGGDREDRVRWDIVGMNSNPSLSGGRARLILVVSCFGTGTQNIQFFTGGQTYACGQMLVDREVTFDSRTGSIVITAVGGEATYVQWVLTGTATRVN